MVECCKKVSKDEAHELVPGKGPIRVRVIFEMPMETRDWPGDFMLGLLVKNETQDKSVKTSIVKAQKYGWHDRAILDDYIPQDGINVYVYNKDKGGIDDGYVAKIEVPVEKFQEALSPELMNANGDKHDVMVLCSVKIRFSAGEWMREISASAQLIDKGAELFVPGQPVLEKDSDS
ncbi:unnamed protein product [Symbiodinium microadriaticum]|nr:unnamed protein product [Symbiodinium microadriaticum]